MGDVDSISTGQSDAIMPIGDVGVLKRIEEQDRRAAKASRLLIKKLSRKKRNRRLTHGMVQAPVLPSMPFASATNFVANENMVVAQRRLVRARDEGGKRAFYVDEIASEDDDPTALLVIPKSAGASVQLLCERVLKRKPDDIKRSTRCVCVVQSCGTDTLKIHGKTTTRALLQKIHIENGLSVFYVIPCENTRDSPPRCLGLDQKTYGSIQQKLVKLMGLQLTS